MSVEGWPARCSISECARLVNAAGIKVDRSNVSRLANKWKLVADDKTVDPAAFASRYRADYTRQSMAGETGGALQPPAPLLETASAPPQPAQQPVYSALDDPKRRLNAVAAERAELELAKLRGETIPYAEAVSSTVLACIAMRAAFQNRRKDAASRLLAALGLSSDRLPIIANALKAYAEQGQEAFAEAAAKGYAPTDTPGTAERALLDALVAHAEKLLAAGDAVATEIREPELAK